MSSFLGEEFHRIGKASKLLGVSVPTVRNWIYSGKLTTVRTAGGEHRIPESEIRRVLGGPIQIRKTILYTKVSTQGQKKDLEIQEQLLEHYAVENGYRNIVKLRDIASGLNGK
jgi:excisionase family DNA binding protein